MLTYDDTTVYPDLPGATHLHDVTGHDMDATLTYEKARASGGSSCNDVAGYDDNLFEANFAGNRTPYWRPGLLDGKGNVILSDGDAFYYKREPANSADCLNKLRYPGGCKFIPFGLRFLVGAKPSDSSYVPTIKTGNAPPEYLCTWNNGQGVYGPVSMDAALQKCHDLAVAGTKVEFVFRIISGDCWDGIHTDTADHRSHIAYQYNAGVDPVTGRGYTACPATHPVHIPFFLFSSGFTVLASDDVSTWHWSSDEMDPSKPHGWSGHVDYGPMAWDPTIAQTIEDFCLGKLLSCQGGNLGNGTALKAADVPRYLINGHYVSSWTNPNRVVPVPPRSASMAH